MLAGREPGHGDIQQRDFPPQQFERRHRLGLGRGDRVDDRAELGCGGQVFEKQDAASAQSVLPGQIAARCADRGIVEWRRDRARSGYGLRALARSLRRGGSW